MEHQGSCEGNYTCMHDGKIYHYRASYRGTTNISWNAVVTWGEQQTIPLSGSISHNILSGHSLQELVRAHLLADIQHSLGEPA